MEAETEVRGMEDMEMTPPVTPLTFSISLSLSLSHRCIKYKVCVNGHEAGYVGREFGAWPLGEPWEQGMVGAFADHFRPTSGHLLQN